MVKISNRRSGCYRASPCLARAGSDSPFANHNRDGFVADHFIPRASGGIITLTDIPLNDCELQSPPNPHLKRWRTEPQWQTN